MSPVPSDHCKACYSLGRTCSLLCPASGSVSQSFAHCSWWYLLLRGLGKAGWLVPDKNQASVVIHGQITQSHKLTCACPLPSLLSLPPKHPSNSQEWADYFGLIENVNQARTKWHTPSIPALGDRGKQIFMSSKPALSTK